MLKRIQINSRKSQTHVYKRFPSLDLAKKYLMTVESLTTPTLYREILDKPLFTLYRRGVDGYNIYHVGGDINIALHLNANVTFTPHNVENVHQLLYQMNTFFQEFWSKGLTEFIDLDDRANLVNMGLETPIALAADDDSIRSWMDVPGSARNLVQAAISSIRFGIYQNGNIFIQVGPFGHGIVLHLTDEGRRIFGTENEYIAFDDTGNFYPYVDATGDVLSGPYNGADSTIKIFEKNAFKHNKSRREIVLETTLPLQPYMFCDERNVELKSELCSYKLPQETTTVTREFDKIAYKQTNRSKYILERNLKTHNTFILTGTELQNIHFRLMLRQYIYNTMLKKYDLVMSEFPIDHDEMWTLMLSFKQL